MLSHASPHHYTCASPPTHSTVHTYTLPNTCMCTPSCSASLTSAKVPVVTSLGMMFRNPEGHRWQWQLLRRSPVLEGAGGDCSEES